MLKLKIWKN